MLEFMAVAGLLFGAYLLLGNYSQLPERIPVHFDFRGEPDSWGGRATIWIIAVVSVILYGSMTLISRAPHLFNFPWVITEDNAERQYRIGRTFLTLLKTEIVWFFAVIIRETIRVGLGESSQLPPTMLSVFLGIVAVSILGFFVLSYRAR